MSASVVRKPKITSQRVSLYIAFSLTVVGLVGVMAASIYSDFILLMAFVEMTSVAMFFILILSLIPAYFPDKVHAESIFYSGLAKEPYMSDDQVYRPNVPLLNTGYDYDWDGYYDKKSVRVEKQ